MMDLNDPLLDCPAMSGPMSKAEAYRRYRALQQLREEFEAKQIAEASGSVRVEGDWLSPDEYLLEEAEINRSYGGPPPHDPAGDATLLAARRYIIARDFNEFDPQRADMLWKLQKQ